MVWVGDLSRSSYAGRPSSCTAELRTVNSFLSLSLSLCLSLSLSLCLSLSLSLQRKDGLI